HRARLEIDDAGQLAGLFPSADVGSFYEPFGEMQRLELNGRWRGYDAAAAQPARFPRSLRRPCPPEARGTKTLREHYWPEKVSPTKVKLPLKVVPPTMSVPTRSQSGSSLLLRTHCCKSPTNRGFAGSRAAETQRNSPVFSSTWGTKK